jgi:hypothetical protein
MPQLASPELDGLMQALVLVVLLLYLAPAVFGGNAPASRLWLRRASIATLAIGVVIALAASLLWFLH